MQRFELAGNKFWEVAVEGASLTTRWGKLGTDGQVKVQTFANEGAATAARLKLIAEKREKGYRELEAAKPAKAPKQTQEHVIVPPSIQQPRASGTIAAPREGRAVTINPDELA